MITNQALRIGVLWVVLSVVLAQIFYAVGELHLRTTLEDQLEQHFSLTLDEAYFNSASDRANDVAALQHIGANINAAIGGMVVSRGYAAYDRCEVQVLSLDGVQIKEAGSASAFSLMLSRNQLEREIVVGYECQPRYSVSFLLAIVLGMMFWGLYRKLPEPLSKSHRYWMNYLLAQGYQGDSAFQILREFSAEQLSFDAKREQLLQQFHDAESANFGELLRLFNDPRMTGLDDYRMQWLQLGLAALEGDHEAAMSLALAEDSLTIDLTAMSLTLRGLPVVLGGTPLFYYAWYALQRGEGEGWVSNPASNRPDLARGAQLAALMEQYGGHGRAINDLEEGGLKAKTLDQNRSRIKEEVVHVLGERLATKYLFEGGRGADGVLMRYRLALAPDKIRVLK